MRSDGGVLYTQIESLLPQFVQQKHPQFTKFVEKYYEFMELNLLTISNVNLNEDKPIQESNDVTLTVTVATGNNAYSNSVNKYYVGGEVSPTLSVNTGTTYIFDQSDYLYDLNSFHPVSNQLPLKCFESYKSYSAAKNILTI